MFPDSFGPNFLSDRSNKYLRYKHLLKRKDSRKQRNYLVGKKVHSKKKIDFLQQTLQNIASKQPLIKRDEDKKSLQ